MSASASGAVHNHPFVGRAEEITDLEDQVNDLSRPPTKGIFVSGIYGSGRKTLAQKFINHQYPEVGTIFPTIMINETTGLEELHLQVLTSLRPTIKGPELIAQFRGFAAASIPEKRRQVAALINSLLHARETAFLVDSGGLQTNDGALEPEIDHLIDGLEAAPHPPVAIIARRMIPVRHRRRQKDLAYVSLGSLKRNSGENLVSRLLRDRRVHATKEQVAQLTDLADGHLLNFYRIVEEVSERGIEPFLASTHDFVEWKHRHSSEYLRKITLDDEEVLILGLLLLAPELDFTAMTAALPIEPDIISERLLRLSNSHIIEAKMDRFLISPPLRVAVEKDSRVSLDKSVRFSTISALVANLAVRLEDGLASYSLIDSAILLMLQEGSLPTAYLAAFILPSHYIWLAKIRYDGQDYSDCVRLCQEALQRSARLSINGIVLACRFLCLAASRLGESSTFETGLNKLRGIANTNWIRSNISFLIGFNHRMRGNLPKAEDAFREALRLSPDNNSAKREMAWIFLSRGNLEEAETYAREAHSSARRNAYFLDMLITVLIRRYDNDVAHRAEINELFEALSEVVPSCRTGSV